MCVCVWNNAIFGNGWHAWTGLGDIFFNCIGYLVSAQMDGGAPVHVTHAVATPMHVRVRNGLPFHLCCSVRTFLKNKRRYIFFSFYPIQHVFRIIYPPWLFWACHLKNKVYLNWIRVEQAFIEPQLLLIKKRLLFNCKNSEIWYF